MISCSVNNIEDIYVKYKARNNMHLYMQSTSKYIRSMASCLLATQCVSCENRINSFERK